MQSVIYTQNIINTLGITGSFKIKDNNTSYLTLTQGTGLIEILKSVKLNITSDQYTGIIFKGDNHFIHNYKNPQNLGNNTFVGIKSGNFLMGGANFADGSNNSGFGTNTLNALTNGYNNTAIGHNVLMINTSGHSNTAVGTFSLMNNTTGSFNTALGIQSLYNNTTGIGNTAIGENSLTSNTTGLGNLAVGCEALNNNTTGADNVAVGNSTLYLNLIGFRNTAVGTGALGISTGAYNTALGYQSGNIVTSGSNLILLGNNSQPSTGTATNQVTLGNSSITSLRCNVQTITSLSDRRDKKNINDLSLGLDFIMKLQPRQFNWDKREWYNNSASDGSKMDEKPTAGFIAQELDSVQNEFNSDWLNLVLKDNPEKWEATYGNLLPVMVKAIQELKEENEKLKAAIDKLKSIEERMTELELRVLKQAILKEIKTAEK